MNAFAFYLGLAIIALGLLVWNQYAGNKALQLQIETVEADLAQERATAEILRQRAGTDRKVQTMPEDQLTRELSEWEK